MGNASSKDGQEGIHYSESASFNPSDTSKDQLPHRSARRESHHGLPSYRATVDPPSASLESAHGTHATPPTHIPASAQLRSNQAVHGRQRSHTSIDRPSSRDLAHDAAEAPPSASSVPTTSTHASQTAAARPRSPSKPVSVPSPAPSNADASASTNTEAEAAAALGGSGPSPASYYMPGQGFTRPPRLPLPIEEEVHAPGSPIISPTDAEVTDIPAEDGQVERQPSMLSTTTMDEEEWTEEMQSGSPNTYQTLIEWEEGGSKVYVTGSFANWDRKFRLARNGPSKKPDVFSTIIPLPAGTHHLLFLVDGIMKASSKMPETVDFTTSLVNYVEVGPYLQPQETSSSATQPAQKTTPIEPRPSPVSKEVPENKSQNTSPATSSSVPPASAPKGSKQAERRVSKKPVDKQFHREIPRHLLDLDAPEESTRFQRASAVMVIQPAPPSLPMFLNKSILNGATPLKDDASVLVLPNHTVLNHLATSSIKNNVLATSATTRYKRKFLTTIMYKPTSDTGE